MRRFLVPTEISEDPSHALHDAERKSGAALTNGTHECAIARAAIDALTEQLAIANRRLDEERACSARAKERTATEIGDVRRQLGSPPGVGVAPTAALGAEPRRR